MSINRRNFIMTIGAAAMAAPLSSTASPQATAVPTLTRKFAIIMVVDQTIPHMKVYQQFGLLWNYNAVLGFPYDEHMCFGLYSAGDCSKKYAKSCAETCNGWIANMRCNGFEKVAVMVWSRRFGAMLTLPLLTTADVGLARTSGHSRELVAAILRMHGKNETSAASTWLEYQEMPNGRSLHLMLDHSKKFEPILLETLPGLT